MNKRNQARKALWLQNSKFKFIPWQKNMITESRNLLHIILELKHQQMMRNQTKKARDQNLNNIQNDIDYEDSHDIFFSESIQKYGNGQSWDFQRLIKNKHAKTKKSKLQMEQQQKQQFEEYPQFLTNFLQKLLTKAQTTKNKLKIEKGLSLEKDFVPDNSHICQYCKRKFAKPCSLGGHISKIHSEERKKEKEQLEMQEWQFETPIRRH